MQLPRTLSTLDLPLAELTAARLDGELYGLADCYCSVGELEQPALRARAALGSRSARLILELGTAAWVWGATPVLPAALEFCASSRSRARLAHGDPAHLRQVVLDRDDDLVDLAGVSVTSPLRTSIDLMRFRDELTDDLAEVVRQLALIGGFSGDDITAALARRRNLPGKKRAMVRYARLADR